MFNVKYATLCLLITYHWHGSWAVSTWPSGRAGIAAEVNGSPTDARLNIPVVKRSSNQADLANELLPLPPLPRRRPDVAVVGDSREQEKPGEFLAVGLFGTTQREYANRTLEKYNESMIDVTGSEKMIIGGTLNRSYGSKSTKWDKKRESTRKKKTRGEAKEREKLEVGIKSLISPKNVAPMDQSIQGRKPSIVIAPRNLVSGRWFHYKRALASLSQGRKKFNGKTRLGDSESLDVMEITSPGKKVESTKVNSGTASEGSAIDGTGVFDVRGTRGEDRAVLSRDKREAILVDIGRINSVMFEARKRRENNEKTKGDYDVSRLPSGSSSLSATESVQRATVYEDRNKPSVGSSSIITSNVEVTKLLDPWRLHQQSRNTQPRTIVQHLRRDANRRSYDSSVIPSRTNELHDTEVRHPERRHLRRILLVDRRNRRQSASQQTSNFAKSNPSPNQLRFIPFYNSYGRNSKSLGSRDSSENTINGIINASDNGQLTVGNIANLPSFDEKQIEKLSKSLGGVFNRHLSGKRRNELPNVRAILPKQVFVAPPRLIYDTKILPAPFSFPMFFQNSRNNANVIDNASEKINDPGSPVNGVFDRKEVKDNSDERLAIPVREDSKESVTSSENFVTPLPPPTDQLSLRVNQPMVPLVSTLPDEIYQVMGPQKMENPSRVREYETFQRDEDEPRLNHESPSETGAKDDTRDNVRSSYDNSVGTYARKDESGSRNVDHSTVIGTINDEYANRQSTSYGNVSNTEPSVRIRTSQMPRGRQGDENYNRGSNKWRGEHDNDHTHYDAKYSFGYLVNDDDTRNDFGHREMRDEGITKGRYHVKLPDGRIQKVDYQVDENGYHAVVSYQNDNAQ